MPEPRTIKFAKLLALLGFLVLICSTYYLRSEVLALSHIRFSADEERARHQLKQIEASYPQQLEQHKIAMENYKLQQAHYEKMLELYRTDRDEYVRLLEAKFQPPQLPTEPVQPTPPELSKKLYEINTQFRARKNQYFATATVLNWIAGAAALALAGGLLYLLLFDVNANRWFYVIALSISFVFLIGPAFHSILTSIIGFLAPPSVY
jgi:hypothetical protein